MYAFNDLLEPQTRRQRLQTPDPGNLAFREVCQTSMTVTTQIAAGHDGLYATHICCSGMGGDNHKLGRMEFSTLTLPLRTSSIAPAFLKV